MSASSMIKINLVYMVFVAVIVFVVNSRTVSVQAEEIDKENAVAEYNNSAIWLLRKAEDEEKLGEAVRLYREAIGLLEKALELDPDNPTVLRKLKSAYHNCGVSYYDDQKCDTAANWFLKLVTLDSSYQEVRHALALIYATIGSDLIDSGECEEGIEEYKKALKIYPGDSMLIESLKAAYYNCGVRYYNDGEFVTAAAWFQNVLDLDPSHKQARNALATTYASIGDNYIERGEYERGIAEYEKAWEVDSTDPIITQNLRIAYHNWAVEAYNQKRYQKAVNLLLNLLKFDPDDVSTLRLLGDSYQQLPDFYKARNSYRSVLNLMEKESALYQETWEELNKLSPQAYSLLYIITVNTKVAEASNFQLELELPYERTSHQKVTLLSSSNKLNTFEKDGVKTALISFPNLTPGQKREIRISYKIETEAVYRAPELCLGGPINFSASQYEIYLDPGTMIETEAWQLRAKARELTKGRVSFYDTVSSIYGFVIDSLKYVPLAEEEGALWAYLNRKGDCTEFTTLFVALCRISGIPARMVSGFIWRPNEDINKNTHAWAEVLSPSGDQWIPFDPALGQDSPSEYFGGITSDHIAFPTDFRWGWQSRWQVIGEQVKVTNRVQVQRVE